jgi:hypothetical protein
MIPELVPSRHEFFENSFVACDLLPDDEKRGSTAELPQCVRDPGRGSRVRGIVDRDREDALDGAYPEKYLRILPG